MLWSGSWNLSSRMRQARKKLRRGTYILHADPHTEALRSSLKSSPKLSEYISLPPDYYACLRAHTVYFMHESTCCEAWLINMMEIANYGHRHAALTASFRRPDGRCGSPTVGRLWP